MKHLYLFLFLIISSYGFGQLSINPGNLTLAIAENQDHVYTLAITNNSANAVTYWWKVKKAQTFPSGWQTQVCDPVGVCFNYNIDECPGSKSITVPANSNVTMTMHFLPNGIIGSTVLGFQLYSDKSFKTLIAETDPNAIVYAGPTSTGNVSNGDIRVYPNPVEDFFIVKNDNNIAKVSLVNIVGKEIFTQRHVIGNSYDVSELNKGVYIVRFMDSRNKVIKSIKLSKK